MHQWLRSFFWRQHTGHVQYCNYNEHAQRRFQIAIGILNMVLPVAILVLFGFVRFFPRKQRYTKF